MSARVRPRPRGVQARLPLLAAAFAMLFAAAPGAAAVVTDPDEVCAPTDDPCVIASDLEVDAASTLDFGLRTVRVEGGGELTGSLDLVCGAFEVNLDPGSRWLRLTTGAGRARATVTARRACSGDAATPCLSSDSCVTAGLGTCSLGDGGIRITGTMSGAPADVELRAAGDIAVGGNVQLNGKRSSADGGSFEANSTLGSVDLGGLVNVSGGPGSEYGGLGVAGDVVLRAGVDAIVRERILGTAGGAIVEIDAGGDVVAGSAILVQGLKGSETIGGTVDLNADGDLDVGNLPGGGSTLVNISGGSYGTSSYYGYGTYAVPGGYGYFRADGNISIGPKVRLRGNSGKHHGYADDYAAAGDWYVEAGGDLYVGAKIFGRARGPYGTGRLVRLRAEGNVDVGRKALVLTRSIYAGYIDVYSRNQGRVTVNGRLDARAKGRFNYGSFYGYGGPIYISGGDITIGGKVRTGGAGGGNEIQVDACRLDLLAGAVINSGAGRQYDSLGYNDIVVRESMTAAKGSRIIAKPASDTEINYRDAAKPPVLDGTTKPAPTLILSPGLAGCPVCGNLEIDQGETCDDGNTVSGDGCDANCQAE